MGLINNEPHCGSEACVTPLDKEPEEGNIEFEEQNPEVIRVLPIQPEPEVSEWFLCIRQQHFMLSGTFTATKRILHIHFNCSYVHTYLAFGTVPYPDQPLHNVYINNKFLYHNFTCFLNFAI